MDTYVIGVDCAAQHARFGLALGRCGPSEIVVTEVTTGQADVLPGLQQWMASTRPSILAFDAPLGWPCALGAALSTHSAGSLLPNTSDQLFHRTTDDFVRKQVKKKPLEVGADKIARAAVSALRVVDAVRRGTGSTLPLLWEPGVPTEPGLIEVYPAATLRAHALSDKGYKGNKAQHRDARKALLARLSKLLRLEVDPELLVASDDALDAVICVLAAADFARGRVHVPTDAAVVKKEGWIWFGTPEVNRAGIQPQADPVPSASIAD